MFTPQPIGFISTPFNDTKAIPKGLGAKHEAEGALNILPAFEQGLTDIEGYSHLIVLWVFDHSDGFDLMATPPIDDIVPMAYFRRDLRAAPTPSASRSLSCWVARAERFVCAAWTCSTARRFWTSSLTCRAFPRRRLRRGWMAEAEARKG